MSNTETRPQEVVCEPGPGGDVEVPTPARRGRTIAGGSSGGYGLPDDPEAPLPAPALPNTRLRPRT